MRSEQNRPDMYPEYRVYTSRDQFTGTDVFEFYAGDFDGAFTRRKPGSVYIREEGFKPFLEVFRSAGIALEWYDNSLVSVERIPALLQEMDSFCDQVTACSALMELKLVDRFIVADEENFLIVRLHLIRMCADLTAVAELARRRACSLWVLGL